MAQKKATFAQHQRHGRRGLFALGCLALLGFLFWGSDPVANWIQDQTDTRILKKNFFISHLGGLERLQNLTDAPFDLFCVLGPRTRVVGEAAGLREPAINAALQERFPKGIPDDAFAFVYADKDHVRMDLYPPVLGPYRLLDSSQVHKDTLSRFMDDIHPTRCASRQEAGFFTFPSGSVLLVRL